MTSLAEVQGNAVDYLDQAGGLCIKEIISPTLAYLDGVFAQLDGGNRGGSHQLDPGSKTIDRSLLIYDIN